MHYITAVDASVGARDIPRLISATDKERSAETRKIRVEQLTRWEHIRSLYATHRDELNDTFNNPAFNDCKAILERVFTNELDDALREVVGEE
jgi:hypothetical protein